VKNKLFVGIGAIALGVLSGTASAITVGTYIFANTDLADQAVLSNGQVWDSTTTSYTTTPAALTDTDATTYASTYPQTGYDNVTIDLGFSQTQIKNGVGADIALFFLSEQSTNTVSVTIGGVSSTNPNPLSFGNVYDTDGNLQVALGLGPPSVYFSVVEIDLADYGFVDGAVMNDPLSLNLIQNDSNIAVSLSMAGSLNSMVVPVPAAVWLFGSGLLGLVGVARRKK